jgi:hypothetical protein
MSLICSSSKPIAVFCITCDRHRLSFRLHDRVTSIFSTVTSSLIQEWPRAAACLDGAGYRLELGPEIQTARRPSPAIFPDHPSAFFTPSPLPFRLACPAVASHLNSGFPKPLAPIGAASQSYQLPPVADLLRQVSSLLGYLPTFEPLTFY